MYLNLKEYTLSSIEFIAKILFLPLYVNLYLYRKIMSKVLKFNVLKDNFIDKYNSIVIEKINKDDYKIEFLYSNYFSIVKNDNSSVLASSMIGLNFFSINDIEHSNLIFSKKYLSEIKNYIDVDVGLTFYYDQTDFNFLDINLTFFSAKYDVNRFKKYKDNKNDKVITELKISFDNFFNVTYYDKNYYVYNNLQHYEIYRYYPLLNSPIDNELNFILLEYLTHNKDVKNIFPKLKFETCNFNDESFIKNIELAKIYCY